MGERKAWSRTEVPDDVVAELMFAADRTCCVCQDHSKPVQIHHIDENPNNHQLANLVTLCVSCHGLTQMSGGFVRKLDAPQVRLYRDDWLSAVERRRQLRDSVSFDDLRRIANQLTDIAVTVTEPSEIITEPLNRNTGRYYRRLEELVRHTRRGDRIAIMSHHSYTDDEWATPRSRAYLQARVDYRNTLLDRATAGVAYQRVLCFDCLERGERVRPHVMRMDSLRHYVSMLELRQPAVWLKKARAHCGPDIFLINTDTVAFSMEAPASKERTYTAGALLMRGRANDRAINQIISWWEALESKGGRVTLAELRRSIESRRQAA